jgi:Tol biopolymer transport system component
MTLHKEISYLCFFILPGIFILIGILTGCAQPDASQLIYSIEGKESAYPRLSNDNTKILYQGNSTGHWQLYIMDRISGKHMPVFSSHFNDNFPDWSYDNQWIAFTSDRDGNEEIYMIHLDGTELKRITHDPGRDIHPYFSPDGKYLLFNSTRANESFDIFRYTIATGELKQLSATPQNETCARYSPDMSQIVYLKNDEVSDDVFIADSLNQHPFNLTNDPQIMDGWPMFSFDNQKIFWSSMENGAYCIYSVNKDRSSKTRHTTAGQNEDDARVSVSRDNSFFIYNKQKGKTIEIREMRLG